MKSLKNLWDTLRPKLNHFNEKYLKKQATYIQQRHYILETQTVANNKENQIVDKTDVRQDEVQDNANDTEKYLNTPPQVQNHLQNEQIFNKELYESLRNKFTINYMKYKNLTGMEQN